MESDLSVVVDDRFVDAYCETPDAVESGEAQDIPLAVAGSRKGVSSIGVVFVPFRQVEDRRVLIPRSESDIALVGIKREATDVNSTEALQQSLTSKLHHPIVSNACDRLSENEHTLFEVAVQRLVVNNIGLPDVAGRNSQLVDAAEILRIPHEATVSPRHLRPHVDGQHLSRFVKIEKLIQPHVHFHVQRRFLTTDWHRQRLVVAFEKVFNEGFVNCGLTLQFFA